MCYTSRGMPAPIALMLGCPYLRLVNQQCRFDSTVKCFTTLCVGLSELHGSRLLLFSPSTGSDICSHQINCKQSDGSLLASVLFGISETGSSGCGWHLVETFAGVSDATTRPCLLRTFFLAFRYPPFKK